MADTPWVVVQYLRDVIAQSVLVKKKRCKRWEDPSQHGTTAIFYI